MPNLCPNCGREIEEDWRYCPTCGFPLNDEGGKK